MIQAMYKVDGKGDHAAIGSALKTLSQGHVCAFDNQRGIKFGYDNCNAAVAVEASSAAAMGYHDGPTNVIGLDFHVVYGSSRLYGGLDGEANKHFDTSGCCNPFSSSAKEQHAEQTAILLAQKLGFAFWNKDGFAHVYVDFSPCDDCEPWLEARPEKWIVHYNVLLKNKTEHKVERQAFHRKNIKNIDDQIKRSKELRLKSIENDRKARRAAMIAQSRAAPK